MGKKSDDKPAVTTFADHEVITPPHKLKKAVRQAAAGDDDPVARAEQALAQLSGEFAAWMDSEIERLDAARRAVHAQGLTGPTRQDLFHSAHDIKGQATTFGYPVAARVADSLCRLLEHSPDATRIPLSLVDQHVDAVRAIVREMARNDAVDVSASLSQKLRAVTDEFLLRENSHRPEYLDGIIAPPLAPPE